MYKIFRNTKLGTDAKHAFHNILFMFIIQYQSQYQVMISQSTID